KKSSIDFQVAAQTPHDIAQLEQQLWEHLGEWQSQIIEDTFTIKTVNIKSEYTDCKLHYILKDPLDKQTDTSIKRVLKRRLVTVLYQ
ncbi:MAG: hypothetical protein RL362_1018, partial [Bacteroidota bacterium]